MTSGGRALAEAMDKGLVVAGGCYDCLSAILLEQAGFSCLYLSGASVSLGYLGIPDVGVATHTELLDVTRRVILRTNVPVVTDIDTGFGGVLNVHRTVEEFAAVGVAAVQLEDQTFPKRCGHLAGKSIVDRAEFEAKIRAADRARAQSDTLIIARTDAIAIEGLDAAIDRANAARQAGADVLFIEAPRSREEIEAICERVEGPKLFNMVAGGVGPELSFGDLREYGFAMVVVAPLALQTVTAAISSMAASILEADDDQPLRKLGYDVTSFFEKFGLNDWFAIDSAASSVSAGR